MADVQAGSVVLAEFRGSGRHFWARVTRTHGSPSNLLCDVNWLRPRAGAPGNALYACESGLDLDETSNWDNISVAKHLRQPTATELAAGPAAGRRRKPAGPSMDEMLGEAVEAAAPAEAATVDPRSDPVKALQAALAAAAAEPAAAGQRAGPNVFDVMAPPQAARMQPAGFGGYASLGMPIAPMPAPAAFAPPKVAPTPAPALGVTPAAFAQPTSASFFQVVPPKVAPAAAQQPATNAFADIVAFPGLPNAKASPASTPPAAPTWAAEAPGKAPGKVDDVSFDFLAGVLSKEMGQKITA